MSWGGLGTARSRFTYSATGHSSVSTPKEEKVDCVEYHPNFLPRPNFLYRKFLKESNFEDRFVLDENDKELYKLNRATCIFGDDEISDAPPKIWGANNPIQPWTSELLKIKTKIEGLTGKKYNICLCNFYKNGRKTINWHSDNEEKGSVSSIASISLGAERKFQLRDKTTDKMYNYILGSGSLFLMRDGCQENYLHRLPEDLRCKGGRINLTFRLFDKMRYSKK